MQEILLPAFPNQQDQVNENEQPNPADGNQIHSKKVYAFRALYHDCLYAKNEKLLRWLKGNARINIAILSW